MLACTRANARDVIDGKAGGGAGGDPVNKAAKVEGDAAQAAAAAGAHA